MHMCMYMVYGTDDERQMQMETDGARVGADLAARLVRGAVITSSRPSKVLGGRVGTRTRAGRAEFTGPQ